jgi:protoporphyrinogen oxidase
VTVIEAQREVGGSAAGGRIEGFSIDGSLPLMRSTDRALLSWIEQSQLADLLLPPRPVGLAQIFRSSVQPIETHGLSELAKIAGVTAWDKKRLLRLPRLMDRYRAMLDPDQPEAAADLDFRSARDFATLYFGNSLWDYWVSPETTCEYADDELELSRVAFLLARIASREGRAPLAVPRRGLWEFAEQAAEALSVARGVRAEQIVALPGGGYSVRCSAADDQSPEVPASMSSSLTLEVDAVVVATSPETAGQIAAPVLVPAERDYFAGYRGGPKVSLTMALSSPIGRAATFVRVPKAEASSIECYLSEEGSTEGRVPEGKGLLTVRANSGFARAYLSASDEVAEKSLLAAIARFHPEAAGRSLFTRLHRSTSGNPNFQVGAYRDLARFARVQEDRGHAGRRIYFAGDYRVGPGANQAIASGRRAAKELRAHFGD